MTTIILSPNRSRTTGLVAPKTRGLGGLVSPKPTLRLGKGGFTFVELMIGSSLGAFILAAVLSTFLFMGRSGANVQNYNDMEAQARKALELFAEDTRQASGVTWGADSNSLTLTVNGASVLYLYDPSAKIFYRRASSGTMKLVTGITTFAFSAYNITGAGLPLATAANLTAANGTTKQLQISLEASRTSTTVVAATNTVLSARFVLRNKKVTA